MANSLLPISCTYRREVWTPVSRIFRHVRHWKYMGLQIRTITTKTSCHIVTGRWTNSSCCNKDDYTPALSCSRTTPFALHTPFWHRCAVAPTATRLRFFRVFVRSSAARVLELPSKNTITDKNTKCHTTHILHLLCASTPKNSFLLLTTFR